MFTDLMDTVLPLLQTASRPAIIARVRTPPTRSRRPEPAVQRPRGRPPVPLDRIVATALQIIDDEGAEALSMRSLAQRLGSGTATLYRHFPNRVAVIAHVIDRVFGEVHLSAEELVAMELGDACRALAHNMFDALNRHRNVAPLLVEQVPVGPNAMALRERGIALLLDNGFPPRLAARSYATLARFVLGFAIQLVGRTDSPDDSQLATVFRSVDPSLLPATAAVAEELPVPLQDEFAFGLELILDGLTNYAAQPSNAVRRVTK